MKAIAPLSIDSAERACWPIVWWIGVDLNRGQLAIHDHATKSYVIWTGNYYQTASAENVFDTEQEAQAAYAARQQSIAMKAMREIETAFARIKELTQEPTG